MYSTLPGTNVYNFLPFDLWVGVTFDLTLQRYAASLLDRDILEALGELGRRGSLGDSFYQINFFFIVLNINHIWGKSTHEIAILCMNYEGKYYGHEYWTPRMCHFVKSMKIGTNENKAIHNI